MKPLSEKLNMAIVSESIGITARYGFSYTPSLDAPSSYVELLDKINRSARTGEPVPVYSEGSEQTIYGIPDINHRFRFWHDVYHWIGCHNFTQEGEIKTAYAQLRTLNLIYGFGPSTLEWQLLYADTVGQTEYYHQTGGFVEDQVGFVRYYMKRVFNVTV